MQHWPWALSESTHRRRASSPPLASSVASLGGMGGLSREGNEWSGEGTSGDFQAALSYPETLAYAWAK